MTPEALTCNCHCGGSMFWRHLHATTCPLSIYGEEAPPSQHQKELAALREQLAMAQARVAELERLPEVIDALEDHDKMQNLQRQVQGLQRTLRKIEAYAAGLRGDPQGNSKVNRRGISADLIELLQQATPEPPRVPWDDEDEALAQSD